MLTLCDRIDFTTGLIFRRCYGCVNSDAIGCFCMQGLQEVSVRITTRLHSFHGQGHFKQITHRLAAYITARPHLQFHTTRQ